MLFQSIDKANLYKLKQITFSKTDVSQSESNENPIRAYQKREDLPERVGGWSRFLVYYCESDPPQKK